MLGSTRNFFKAYRYIYLVLNSTLCEHFQLQLKFWDNIALPLTTTPLFLTGSRSPPTSWQWEGSRLLMLLLGERGNTFRSIIQSRNWEEIPHTFPCTRLRSPPFLSSPNCWVLLSKLCHSAKLCYTNNQPCWQFGGICCYSYVVTNYHQSFTQYVDFGQF